MFQAYFRALSVQIRILRCVLFCPALFLLFPALAGSDDFSHLKAQAEKGDAEAQAQVGLMYARGGSVPQDFSEALRWLGMAAEQGNAEAQFNLSSMYFKRHRSGSGLLQGVQVVA